MAREKCKRVTRCHDCRKIMDVGEQRYTYNVKVPAYRAPKWGRPGRGWEWDQKRYLCVSCAAHTLGVRFEELQIEAVKVRQDLVGSGFVRTDRLLNFQD